ncbi:hypothetical protein PG996_011343 [Apiospora saccharicola]|uniref:Uncharacterized protein n=1 Tax=Apiospora saccharicola TaxID=335842 RepID=A0ABR1UET3_9PEZI
MWVVVEPREDAGGESSAVVGEVGEVGSEEKVESAADEADEVDDDAECVEDLTSPMVLMLSGCGWNWNGRELWKPRVGAMPALC